MTRLLPQQQRQQWPLRRRVLDSAHLSLGQYVVVALVILIGAAVQGTVGFGLNLVSAPLVGAIAPQLLPTTMIVVGVPLSIAIALTDHEHIDWRGVGWISLGRLPGSVAGALVVAALSTRALGGTVGVIVLLACLISLVSVHHSINWKNSLGAGVASGFMDTAASTGGPPLALLYQHRPAGEVRGTFAVAFPIGSVISIVALAAGGAVHEWQILIAALFLPSLAAGYFIGRALIGRLAGRSLRPAVLSLAALGGVAAIVRSLV